MTINSSPNTYNLECSGTISAISTKNAAQTAWIEPPTKKRTITNIKKLLENDVTKEKIMWTADRKMIIVRRPKLSEI